MPQRRKRKNSSDRRNDIEHNHEHDHEGAESVTFFYDMRMDNDVRPSFFASLLSRSSS